MKKFLLFLVSLVYPLGLVLAAGSTSQALIAAAGRNSNVKFQKGLGGSETCSSYKVGDLAQGGVVIWVTEDGQHGLVAALADAKVGVYDKFAWGPTDVETNAEENNPLPITYTNSDPKENYSGYKNQAIIEAILNWEDNYPAFNAASEYTYTQDGVTYDDWFLPCSSELSLMYALRKISVDSEVRGVIPDMATKIYWSSREFDNFSAWVLSFSDGYQYGVGKGNACAVRCVRAF